MSIVKRQHYVWRHYLRAWADNESIYTYLIENNRIEKTGLMSVAQEKYFYKLEDFSSDEEVLLKELINKMSHPTVKQLNMDFLSLFTSTGKLKKQLDNTTNSLIDKEICPEKIRELEINLMEEAHGKMENLGHKLIACRSLEDLKEIENDDYFFDAILFICFQYFRTKVMKKSVHSSFNGDNLEEFVSKAWNIVSYSMGTILARNISLNENLKFIFIENTTDKNFITGDQPVFNILNDQLNENGEVTCTELYYPISPKHALIIHFDHEQTEKYIGKSVNAEMVEFYNSKVIENSSFFVFSDNRELLEWYKSKI